MQAKFLITAAALGTAGLLIGTAAKAEPAPLAAETGLTNLPSPTAAPAPATTTSDATPAVAEGEPLVCPPGQFPSAFADVYPWEWAYQAVNNLASPSMTCFDLPEDRPQ
ncbi:hypothetical protein [Leptolyngbya iicbica]|uniref:Porin n=2 Tax=Cyanophyceae TaxID=3028117 RepID=A0A4V2E1Q3_9CYAN|nr:hypothetical protein [Leptolyngbya sp. LK]RZM74833.1 hypothetical protein DYY88_22595 [Leptolyngbya sp. LK]